MLGVCVSARQEGVCVECVPVCEAGGMVVLHVLPCVSRPVLVYCSLPSMMRTSCKVALRPMPHLRVAWCSC